MRGFARHAAPHIGNFWTDITRSCSAPAITLVFLLATATLAWS